MLQYRVNWKQLSLIAGVSCSRFCFRSFNGAIKGPQIVECFKALQAPIHGNPLAIWDALPAHRSAVVRDYLESLDGHIQVGAS